jgi:hypothetical protein
VRRRRLASELPGVVEGPIGSDAVRALSAFEASRGLSCPVVPYTLVAVDHFAPVQAGIDKAHRIAFRAAKVGATVTPILGWHAAQLRPAVVV